MRFAGILRLFWNGFVLIDNSTDINIDCDSMSVECGIAIDCIDDAPA